MRGAPPELPGSKTVESPIDRALSLALANEREAALRWAAAVVQLDPGAPSGLLLSGRLLADCNRQEVAREALEVCISRAIDAGILPLAVAACSDLRKLGHDPSKHFDTIADAFSKDSRRLGDGSPPPPPLPSADDFHPLPSVLTGMALLNKTTAIIHEARKALDDAELQRDVEPLVNPSPLFSAIGRSGLRKMIEVFEVETVPKGARVIEQGAIGAEAYIVARGELEVIREPEQEGEPSLSLARLHSGAIFGEMALILRAPRAASVKACKPSIVLRGRKDALDLVAEAEPEVGAELAAHCRRRMVQNLLRTSPILGAVAPSEQAGLVDRFETRTYEKGEKLIAQGEPAQGLAFIASGEVAVIRIEGDEPFVLANLGVGDTVGEVSLVLRRPSTADVVAVHPTVLLYLPRETFLELIKRHPLLLAQVYDLAIRRDDETSSFSQQEVLSVHMEDFIII
jgi:CRP-like cAMP-binding protein